MGDTWEIGDVEGEGGGGWESLEGANCKKKSEEKSPKLEKMEKKNSTGNGLKSIGNGNSKKSL